MSIPPRRPPAPSVVRGYGTQDDRFEYYIPILIITKSPLLARQRKSDSFARTIINAKRWYSECDPIVRSFVYRGAHDEAVNFSVSHDYSSFVPGYGGARLEIITDYSTGVSFAFESSNKKTMVSFRTEETMPWIKISENTSDFMFLMSLRMTILAIHRKDSELSQLRETEAARIKVLAMYGNK